MVKTRGQKQNDEKKQKKAEVKYEFKNNPNFTPVSTGELRHSMNGRKFFYVKFEGNGYTHDKIQRFVQRIATKYHERDEAKYIQVCFDYSNEGFKSSKLYNVDEQLDLDFDDRYGGIEGLIQGFQIYLA